ncbi:MAG: ABC transporter ATP-binding protein [Acidobacteriota bacterium]
MTSADGPEQRHGDSLARSRGQAVSEVHPRLQAVELTKQYEDGVLALDHVSFSVFPGQVYAMLGANGAGKTTTINLFLNFIDPTSGEARVGGIVSHKKPLEAKACLAYVSENVMLYPNLTALQNLDFFARLGGRSGCTRADLESVLRRVGLQADAHDKRLKSFSKGMRQKCGLAIAIIKNAPAIILDEPTAGLDPQAVREFLGLLDQLRSEDKAILMSTHDLFRAREIADIVGMMRRGRLVLQRSRADLEQENLEELYLRYMAD